MKYYYFKMEKKEEIDSAVKKCQQAEIRLKNKKSEWDRKKKKYDEIRIRKEKEKKRYNELMDGINDTLTKVSTIRDARIQILPEIYKMRIEEEDLITEDKKLQAMLQKLN